MHGDGDADGSGFRVCLIISRALGLPEMCNLDSGHRVSIHLAFAFVPFLFMFVGCFPAVLFGGSQLPVGITGIDMFVINGNDIQQYGDSIDDENIRVIIIFPESLPINPYFLTT